MDSNPKVKVVYITGAARSGGTILGHILGQIPGYFFAGELKQLWGPNPLDTRLCGCGKKLLDCEKWESIFNEAFGGLDKIDLARLWRLRADLVRTRHIPKALLSSVKQSSSQREFSEYLGQLYLAVRKVTDCQVIIDTSRLIPYGHMLDSLPTIDLKVVHLIRDSRAVVYSWRKDKTVSASGQTIKTRQLRPFYSSLDWDIQNLAAEMFWGKKKNYLRLKYESFVAYPEKAIHDILTMAQESLTSPKFKNGEISLDIHHSCGGNIAYRLQSGIVKLRIDNDWERRLSHQDRNAALMLTWPLLLRYRYGIQSC